MGGSLKIAMLKGAPSVAQFLYKFGISVDVESLGKCFESCDGNDENCKMDCIIALTDIVKSGSLELLGSPFLIFIGIVAVFFMNRN